MDSSSTSCPFDGLPLEIIHIIFDYLDLKSMKSLSLTCHRWERICSGYFTRSCVLLIDGHIPKSGNSANRYALAQRKIEETTLMLQRTERLYRNVHLMVQSDNIPVSHTHAMFNALFQPRWLQQLVILKLDMWYDPQTLAVDLSNAVARMDCVQELHIRYLRFIKTSPISELKLVNPSLHKLVLCAVMPAVIDCPGLRKLEVTPSMDLETIVGKQYAQYDGEEPYWKLKQLEELVIMTYMMAPNEGSGLASDTIPAENRPGYKVHFYRQMIRLKRLYHHGTVVSERILRTIGESCLQLEDLFINNINTVDPNSMHYLSNLTHLRLLGILRCEKVIPAIRLPSLERLLLGNVIVEWEAFAAANSIKWLKIALESKHFLQLCKALVGKFKQLNFLWIVFPDLASRVTWHEKIYHILPDMPALKTLVLENFEPVKKVWKQMRPMPQLARLVIYRPYGAQGRNTRGFSKVKELFPNARIEIGAELDETEDDAHLFEAHDDREDDFDIGDLYQYCGIRWYEVDSSILRDSSYRAIRNLR